MSRRAPLLLTLIVLAGGLAGSVRAADSVSVAAASNLVFVLNALAAEFRRGAPEVQLNTTTGASGTLVAQITHGASFDVFLSADTEYTAQLVAAGLADAATERVFATGRLALWTLRPDLDLRDLAAALRTADLRRIAIAQPRTAPYGRAAQAVLEKLGLWREVQTKIVLGENITQAAQFVDTGHADVGFVALSVLRSSRLRQPGRWIEIPPALHGSVSLAHAAVLTTRGQGNPAARRFLGFLCLPPAQQILRDHGYRVP